MNEESVDPFEIELERAMAHQAELDRIEQTDRMREEEAEVSLETEEEAIEEPIVFRNSNGADINSIPSPVSPTNSNIVYNTGSIGSVEPPQAYQQQAQNLQAFDTESLQERADRIRQENQERVNESIFGESFDEAENPLDQIPPPPQVDAAVSEKKKVVLKKGEEKFEDKILRIAIGTLGESNVSIESNRMNGTEDILAIILKWDYLNMFNRHNNKHDIKDMYVALPITSSSFQDYIHGFRGKVTYAEHRSGYSHSHLWSGSYAINPFCTGNDGINDLWADLKMSRISDKDFEIKWEGFIHQMEAFLCYESIEGTPYIRFNNISAGRTRQLNSASIKRNADSIITNMKASDLDLAMDFNSATVAVIETEYLHDLMAMYATNHQKRLENGSYVELDANQQSSSGEQWLEGSQFNFKGRQKVYVEPFHINKTNGSTERKYAHGKVVSEIKRRIETEGRKRIEAFCIKNSVSIKNEEEGPSHYWRKFDTRDLVPVGTEIVEGVVGSTVLETE